MLKERSLSTQINLSVLGILSCTFVSTVVIIFLFLVVAQYVAYPANHYEQQLPMIVDYVNQHSSSLLIGEGKEEFERTFDLSKVTYQIVNFDTEGESDLISKLNTTQSDGNGNYTKYIPLTDSKGTLKGCLSYTYPLRLMPLENRQFVYLIMFIGVFSLPFLFLIFYMWFFGKKLKINVMIPLQKLKWASQKIENQDLDFELHEDYNNEFNEVIVSFEKMRKTLKETLTKQWQIEQQQKELISALAHDLRSPLTVIKGHVELLQDGAYQNEARCLKYLNVLEGATNRSIVLVEDLNLLSQLDQLDFIFQQENVNVLQYFSTELESYEDICLKYQLNLRTDLDLLNPTLIMKCDPLRLSRVLDNILMNACRYAPTSSDIGVLVYQKNKAVICEITDQGNGFSEEDLKYGLEKFYRGNKARSKDGGSGLGLYICQRIMKLHGGEIVLSNQESGGAKVVVYLPLQD